MSSFRRYQFGDTEVVVLSDGVTSFPSEFVMVGVDEQARLDACRKWGFDASAVDSNMNVVYINTVDQSLLFDTGAGLAMPGCGHLPGVLSDAGIDPASIDRVIHTHLHPDHIGWNVTADGAPMFPMARFCVGETEFGFWSSEETQAALRNSELWNLPDIEPAMAQLFRSNVQSLGDRIELVPDDGVLVPGVRAIPAFGHTPGHLAFEVDLGDESLLIAGDLAVSVIHLEHLSWFAAVDLDPEMVIESRVRILELAETSGMLVAGYHFPFPGLGRVSRSGDGWAWHAV